MPTGTCPAILPVQPSRRGCGVRQPVQRDIVQHLVFRLGLAGVVAVRPLREPRMPQEEGREAGRGVGEAVPDGLRPRGQRREVARVPALAVGAQRVENGSFLLRHRRHWSGAGQRRFHVGRYSRGQVDVDASQSGRCLPAHRLGDDRPPVSALCDVAGVSQALHKLVPGVRDPVRIPAGRLRTCREAVAGQRGDDEVECVLGRSAVCRRVGERFDHLQQFEDRPRPAVGHDQRQRVLVARADVDEVDV
jgi:hypothetical protein